MGRTRLSLLGFVLALAAAVPTSRAYGLPTAGSHLEGGLGSTAVAGQTTTAATVGAGISMPFRHGARAAMEFCASADWSSTEYIPEGPIPGSRSLTTFLLGVEVIDSEKLRGPFAFFGLGVGHSTLSGGRGSWRDFPDNVIPPRNETGFAIGGGVGYRSSGGPGPLGFQLALRTHAAVKEGQTPASAIALTIGLIY